MFILPEIPLSPKRYFEDFVPQIMFDDMIHSSSMVYLAPNRHQVCDLGSMIVSSPIFIFELKHCLLWQFSAYYTLPISNPFLYSCSSDNAPAHQALSSTIILSSITVGFDMRITNPAIVTDGYHWGCVQLLPNNILSSQSPCSLEPSQNYLVHSFKDIFMGLYMCSRLPISHQ